MSSNLPTVSVVIPALNAASTLPEALKSVADQTYPNIIEVIVAAGDEASATAAEDRATVVPNPSQSTSTALNLAIARSNGEVIVRCDAQSKLPPDYVDKAIQTMRRTGADVVGGMQVPVGETQWEKAIAAAMTSPFGAGDARYRTGGEEGPTETVYLGVYRRETLERVGGFDEDFVRTQDYELNHRITESGGTVWFNPEIRVEYQPRSTLVGLSRQYFGYGQAKRQFRRKHPGALRWRQLLPPLLVGGLAVSLLGSVLLPVLVSGPILYLLAMAVAGATTGASSSRVALALVSMHLSWGCGFLSGRGGSGVPGR